MSFHLIFRVSFSLFWYWYLTKWNTYIFLSPGPFNISMTSFWSSMGITSLAIWFQSNSSLLQIHVCKLFSIVYLERQFSHIRFKISNNSFYRLKYCFQAHLIYLLFVLVGYNFLGMLIILMWTFYFILTNEAVQKQNAILIQSYKIITKTAID